MHQLGQTRSANCADHLLQTPDTFVRSPMPAIEKGLGIVHIAPVRGARFLQYTAELEEGGLLKPVAAQRFVYVLEGELQVEGATLSPGGYAYCPPGGFISLQSKGISRVEVIEKPYQSLEGFSMPEFFAGQDSSLPSTALNGDEALQVKCLIPSGAAFDFAVNTMTFQPGASLHMVEVHVMEHGMLMLEGGGIYRLGNCWYPVTEGDFIWMAPYCPQWFGALGTRPAKYLLYKDWNR
jgi:(S)-ureidoglycine aminohydrolase